MCHVHFSVELKGFELTCAESFASLSTKSEALIRFDVFQMKKMTKLTQHKMTMTVKMMMMVKEKLNGEQSVWSGKSFWKNTRFLLVC
jgi:hypothetical protein